MKRAAFVLAALPPDPARADPLLRLLPRFQKLSGLFVRVVPRAAPADLDLVFLPDPARLAGLAPLDALVPPLDLAPFPPDALLPLARRGRLLALPAPHGPGSFGIPRRAPNPHGAQLLLRCFCTPRPLPGTLAHHGEHGHEAPF